MVPPYLHKYKNLVGHKSNQRYASFVLEATIIVLSSSNNNVFDLKMMDCDEYFKVIDDYK